MIKLIATDIDGTLIGQKREISQQNLEAIRYASKQGIHFAIASGRAYQDILPVIQDYHIPCEIIAINGGQYYNANGELLVNSCLGKMQCETVCRIFKENNLHYMLYTSKGVVTEMDVQQTRHMFVLRKKEGTDLTYQEIYNDFQNKYVPFKTLTQVSSIHEFIKDADVYKVEGFDQTHHKIDSIKLLLSEIEEITYLSSFDNNLEVTHIDAKKGNVLMKVIDLLKISQDEVMVIGDGLNDISMFELFENSFAVANAVDLIKQKAKYIVPSCDDDGVAKAIYMMIP